MRLNSIASFRPSTVLNDDDLADPARFGDKEGRRGATLENPTAEAKNKS